ncbi:MAG: vWA domain-containing protein [Candidatus Saccharimonadales bacterium]
MAGVALQLETDQPQAVWQPVVRSAARQDVAFGGLDVHLVVDVSGSMASGGKAQCAADTALCLTEGLQLARYKVAQDSTQYQQPDVRVQITAFGSGAEVLSPLSQRQPDHKKVRPMQIC